MAIGLSNVHNRKAKRIEKSAVEKTVSAQAAGHAVELKSESKSSNDAWSSRGLAREGRSAQRERSISSGDLNTLWLDWTTCVTGTESPNRVLRTVRRILDLETFVFEFLVYDLQIPARAKKRIMEIRSRSARLFEIRKLLTRH